MTAPPIPSPSSLARVGLGLGVLALALFAYLYDLGGLEIPRTGDEPPYVHVTRLTAANGRLLPLQGEQGLRNTKPPLLFWIGAVATAWGRHFDLFHLRLPIVLFSLGTAWLVFGVAARLGGDRRSGAIAALAFLAFLSTFQYGRPFLVNMPETFFVFLPFAGGLTDPRRLGSRGYWVAAGLSIGAACLVKSFALVAPVGVAFAVWLYVRARRRRRRPTPAEVGWVAASLAIALCCFALWPLLDPDPGAVLHDFVLGENAAKVAGGGWVRSLVSPTHGLWTTLLGPFFNAGILALPLAFVWFDAWRRRRDLSDAEVGLWSLALAFVVVFSIPAHRQANYLIPASPAFAVLLGLAWERIPRGLLRVTALAPAGVALVALGFLVLVATRVLSFSAWAPWQIAVPAATLAFSVLLVVRGDLVRLGLFPACFGALLSIACAAAPFDGAPGRFDPATVAAVRGRRVWVPSSFRAREERARFLLPGADVRAYPAKDAARRDALVAGPDVVAVDLGPGEAPPAGAKTLGARWALRTRQTGSEIEDLLLHGRADVLLQREVLLAPTSVGDGPR